MLGAPLRNAVENDWVGFFQQEGRPYSPILVTYYPFLLRMHSPGARDSDWISAPSSSALNRVPNSDIDILVVVPESHEPGYTRDRAAHRALRGSRAPVEVLVWTREEFDRGLRIRTSLSSSIKRHGRLLYAG